jgi:hypothetical protein
MGRNNFLLLKSFSFKILHYHHTVFMKNYYTLIIVAACFTYSASAQNTKHTGEKVNVCGKISAGRSPETNAGKSTVITITNTATAAPVNVVIRQEDRKNFGYKPEEYLYSKNVCVTGTATENNGRTEVIIRRPEDIKIEDNVGGAEIRPFDIDGLSRFLKEEN